MAQFSKDSWPAEGPVRALLSYLDRLHRGAGQPSLTEIGKAVALAPSTLSAFFTGRRLISQGNLELVVEFLRGDIERAERLRRRAAPAWNATRAGASRRSSNEPGSPARADRIGQSRQSGQSRQPGPSGQLVVGDIPVAAAALQPRDDLLASLREATKTGMIASVTGGRGVGKTQLAAAYARDRVADGWPVVVWLAAQTADRLLAGLAELADLADIRPPESSAAKAARIALVWLRTRPGPVLLIFDNAEDPDLVHQWSPAVGNVQTVITTHRTEFANLGPAVVVDQFTDAEALAYLNQRTGLDDPDGAQALALELGHLPLALAQAAAAIGPGRENASYQAFLTQLRGTSVDQVLRAVAGTGYPQGVASTLLLSYTQLATADPDGHATVLAQALAVLSPDGVDRALFSITERDKTIAVLVYRALATTAGTGGHTVRMHRLTQRVIRDYLAATGQLDAVVLGAVGFLARATIPERQAWARRVEVLHQLDQVETLWANSHLRPTQPQIGADAIAALLAQRVKIINLLLWTYDSAQTTAIDLGTAVVADCQRVLGESHPDTLAARRNLAGAYRLGGRLAEAIASYEQTVAEHGRVFGEDHPVTLDASREFAYTYRLAGRLAEAIPLQEQILDHSVRVLGPDHPDTLDSRHDLASAYRLAGRLAEAIALHEQCLAEYQRVLGEDHPDTLLARLNLARAYESAGRLTEAVESYEHALTDHRRVRGEDHPHTLNSRRHLAGAYRAAGRLAEAISLYEQALADRGRVLGGDHPDTLASRNDLAGAYQDAGRLAEAISLYEQALADCERVLSADHPLIMAIRENLHSSWAMSAESNH